MNGGSCWAGARDAMISEGIQAAASQAYAYTTREGGLANRFSAALYRDSKDAIDRGYAVTATRLEIDNSSSTTTAFFFPTEGRGAAGNAGDIFLMATFKERGLAVEGSYSFVAHANEYGIMYGNQLLSWAEAADTIRENGWKPGQPLVFWACDYGNNGYAAWGVAQALGVPVTAFEGSVYPGAFGTALMIFHGGQNRAITFQPNESIYDPRKYYK